MSSKPTVVVSGASSGFGRSLALQCLERGYNVVATARSLPRLAALKDAGAHVLAMDVTAPDAALAEGAAEAAEALGGAVTHVFACAGYIVEGAWEEAADGEVEDMFATNVFGMIKVVRAFLPYLRAQGEAWKKATAAGAATDVVKPAVVTFGSVVSWYGQTNISFYCGSKWACSGLTEGLRDELEPFGIDVTCVEPGNFRTEFLHKVSDSAGANGTNGAGGPRVFTRKSMDIYSGEGGPVWKQRQILNAANDHQPGDPDKGSAVVLDIVFQTNGFEGKEIPVRVPLGADAVAGIRKKCQETLKLLEELEGVVSQTAHA